MAHLPERRAHRRNPNTPQTTEQTKWQFRDDFSWSMTGFGGIGHDFRAGVNFIHEPHLFITFNGGSVTAADAELRLADFGGPPGDFHGGAADINIPVDLYALYIQDDWRVTEQADAQPRAAVRLRGRRAIDQATTRTSSRCRLPASSGRLDGMPFLEDFGQETKNDGDNIQPRLGFAYDLNGNGPQHHPRRMGHLPGLRLHQLEHPVPGARYGRLDTDRCSSSTTRPAF